MVSKQFSDYVHLSVGSSVVVAQVSHEEGCVEVEMYEAGSHCSLAGLVYGLLLIPVDLILA